MITTAFICIISPPSVASISLSSCFCVLAMSMFLDAMRGAVSKDKRRYQKNGFDLGLDVTPRIIAMGFPSESMEATYRNPIKEVLRFLDSYHKDHYKVYNLCSERGYDPQKFYGRVGLFPFDDHNAPPFEMIALFCNNVQEWLDEDSQNIAVVHCKAGKGRTGLMICAWLLFSREWRTPDEALDFYAAMRTANRKGVTIPSQIRYVKYFHESLSSPVSSSRPLLLQRVIFHTLPKTGNVADTNFTIQVGKTLVFNYKQYAEGNKLREPKVRRTPDGKKRKKGKREVKKDSPSSNDEDDAEISWRDYLTGREQEETEDTATFECGGIPVCGDVKIDFDKQGTRMFAFWINTSFIKASKLVIAKSGLDKGHKDKHHKLYEDSFCIDVIFSELDQDPPRKLASSPSATSLFFPLSTPPSPDDHAFVSLSLTPPGSGSID